MGSKRQMTQAKLARERDVKEKRARKLERRAERKRLAAEGPVVELDPITGEPIEVVVEDGADDAAGEADGAADLAAADSADEPEAEARTTTA